MSDQPALPDWVRPVDHPVIVRTCNSTTGDLSFESASPHLVADDRERFFAALRRDVSLLDVERARPIFREVPRGGELQPETCTPYLDANASGFWLRNVLPLVFVKTRAGEVLPDARVALKYMRENAREFAPVLERLAAAAPRIFTPDGYAELARTRPLIVSDVAQPYASFSNSYMALRAGLYVRTPPGLATLLGPPINQSPPLSLHTGLMESEWHHSELFLVFDCPRFDGRTLVVEPGTVLAQLQLVASAAHEATEIVFEPTHLGADPAYRARSIAVGLDLMARGKEFLVSETTGVKSVSVACPHCWVSVTAAAEGPLPTGHSERHDFYKGYKSLGAEYRRARGRDPRK